MTDPGRAEEPAGEDSAVEESPDQEGTPRAESEGEAVEVTQQAPSAEEQHAEPETGDAEDTPAGEAEDTPAGEAEDTSATRRSGSKKGLLIGLGSGALAGIIVGLGLAGLVKPAFLIGPGKPDGKASAVTAALASKNADAMAKASCRGPDGQLSQQLPPQLLQLVQSVKPAGPPHLSLDTEATAPVDVTVTSQGQTQTVPVDIVLGVTNGEWCMTGIAQRQQ